MFHIGNIQQEETDKVDINHTNDNKNNNEKMRSSSPFSSDPSTNSTSNSNLNSNSNTVNVNNNGKTLEGVRPIFRKSSSGSNNSLKLSQLPHIETSLNDESLQSSSTTNKRIINVNESLLETVKNKNPSVLNDSKSLLSQSSYTNNIIHTIPSNNTITKSPPLVPIPNPTSILSNSSNPTPITPLLKTSNSSISFQVPNQKHRGSISARPSTTKISMLDSPQSGIPSSRQPSTTTIPTCSTILNQSQSQNQSQTPNLMSRQTSQSNSTFLINSSVGVNVGTNVGTTFSTSNVNVNTIPSGTTRTTTTTTTTTPTTIAANNVSNIIHNQLTNKVSPLYTPTAINRDEIKSPINFDLSHSVISSSSNNNNNNNSSKSSQPISPNYKIENNNNLSNNLNHTSSVSFQNLNFSNDLHNSPITLIDSSNNSSLPTTPLLSATSNKSRKSSLQNDNNNNTNTIYESKSGISSTSSINQNISNKSTPNSCIKKKQPLKAIVSQPIGPVVPFTQYLCKEDDDKIHILIGATGSVATIKIPLIIDKLFKIYGHNKVSIQLVVTKAAEHFLRGLKISTEVKIWREQEEWSNPVNKIKPGDPILHVELRKWADIFLIAPLSANSLSKICNGLADNLLTSIVRIWNPAVPIILAPAMNTFMYSHPITKIHLNIIKEDFKFIEILKPIEKILICGDIGMGGMREWSEIVDILIKKLKIIKKKKFDEKEKNSKLGDNETLKNENLNENFNRGDINKDDEDDDDDDDDEDDEDDEDEEEEDEDDEDDDDEDEDDDDDDDDDDNEGEDEEEVEEVEKTVKVNQGEPLSTNNTNTLSTK